SYDYRPSISETMKPIRHVLVLVGVVACITVIAFAIRFAHPARTARAAAQPTGLSATHSPTTPPRPFQTYSDFQRHPFNVSLSRAACEWTAEDGRDTNVIRRLAHNELEYARMFDENSRIFRRQLVY